MDHREVEWEPDEAVTQCPLCHHKFSFFYRHHHCRRCGKVICGSCSTARLAYNPGDVIASPPYNMFMESHDALHRTCDLCVEELLLLNGNRHESDTAFQSEPVEVPSASGYLKDITVQRSTLLVQDDQSESGICPVCGENIATRTDQAREEHVNSCLIKAEFSGSPDQKRTSNRMLVYDIPYPEKKPLIVSCSDSTLPDETVSLTNEKPVEYEECVICLEELLPGDKVGRLECLCVYHYKCIKSWFRRKGPGDCPVHAVHL